MSADEARAIADEQIAEWKAAPLHLSPVGAWAALTGQWVAFITWERVADFMVGWLLGRWPALRRAA